LQQLLQLALSEPNPHDPTAGDCPDIEHHSSGMLKDLLKSSFSYFMGSSVAKPKPSDAQFILIFVVGGVTPSGKFHDQVDNVKKQGDRLIPRCEGRAVMESRRNQFPLPPPLLESIAT
jgi:hypothetical protein